MSDSASDSGDVFDLKKLRQLVVLMNEHDLGEIDLRQGPLRIRLRKQGELASVPIEVRQSGAAAPAARQAAAAPAPPSDEHLRVIKSPIVGTFYAAPSPDAPAFVKIGDHVGKETTVCIIEAMKVFNPIQAEMSGQVVAVLVETGAPVEFGQPLFKVDPRQ